MLKSRMENCLMLNELHAIAKAMEGFGIGEESLHPHIIPVPTSVVAKAPKFIVYVKDDGTISKVELADPEVWKTYKYYYPDASNQFPVIKFSSLWGKDEKDSEEFFKNAIPDILPKKVSTIMGKLTRNGEYLSSILSSNKQSKPVHLFTERLLKIDDHEKFLQEAVEKAMNLLPISSDNSKQLLKKDALKGMYLTFELDDYNDLGIYPLNHAKTSEALSDALKDLDKKKIDNCTTGDKIDIFGEPYQESASAHLPQLNFGGSKFKLYSRNINAPCNKSYEVSGGDACPLSPISKALIVNNIQYLTQPDHKGIYWDTHSNKNGTSTATVIFAPVEKTDMAKFQNMLKIGFSFEDVKKEVSKRVVDECGDVIASLRGSKAYDNNEPAHILFLNIPGNGPSVLTFSKVVGVKDLVDCASRWVEGWKNHTHSKLFVKKGVSRPTSYDIDLDAMRKVVNKRWNRSANLVTNEKEMIHDFINSENVFKMFLGDINETKRISHIFGNYHAYLLIDMVNRIHNGQVYNLRGCRLDIFKLPVAFGEILHLLGYKKEDYENSLPYMIGQLFARVSKVQRKMSDTDILKKTLIGTDHIHLVLNTPDRAINLLLSNAQIYLSKAKINKRVKYLATGSDDHFDYYYLQQAAKVIIDNQIPNQWSDIDRMLIALGYFLNR